MEKWLLYVRYNLSGLRVFSVETDDILHCIGALYYTSLERIDRVSVVPYTEGRVRFWNDNNVEIIERNVLHKVRKDVSTTQVE